MNAFDMLLLAAVVAALFLNIVSVAVQKYWRLYTVFFGKKYDIWVHRALIIIAWVQVLVTLVLAMMNGSGDWSQPVIGLAVVAVCVYIFAHDLSEMGLGALTKNSLFDRGVKQPKGLHKHLYHYLDVACIGAVLGLGVFSGRTSLVLSAAILCAGLVLLSFVKRPSRPAKKY